IQFDFFCARAFGLTGRTSKTSFENLTDMTNPVFYDFFDPWSDTQGQNTAVDSVSPLEYPLPEPFPPNPKPPFYVAPRPPTHWNPLPISQFRFFIQGSPTGSVRRLLARNTSLAS